MTKEQRVFQCLILLLMGIFTESQRARKLYGKQYRRLVSRL
ncbi:hypothetical protein [Paenibacillus thiaminolyticus]|nr:hypothetical protein [Paenibacillus thiaminolyticus]